MTHRRRYRLAAITLVLVLGFQGLAVSSANADPAFAFASYEDAVPGVAPVGAEATEVYVDMAGQEMVAWEGREGHGGDRAVGGLHARERPRQPTPFWHRCGGIWPWMVAQGDVQ